MSPSRGRALVEGCLAEKPGAWDAFLEAYGPFVWSLCLGRGLPRDLAGDAFQATFVIIWQNLGALRDPVALLCWVGRIARREIERIRRTEAAHQRNRLHVALDALPSPDEIEPPERLERLEDAQLLRDVIDGIPEPYRSVLCTLFLGGEPPVYEKAAREIHVPRNSISQIRARALDLLRRRLLRLRKNQIFFVSAPD